MRRIVGRCLLLPAIVRARRVRAAARRASSPSTSTQAGSSINVLAASSLTKGFTAFGASSSRPRIPARR